MFKNNQQFFRNRIIAAEAREININLQLINITVITLNIWVRYCNE